MPADIKMLPCMGADYGVAFCAGYCGRTSGGGFRNCCIDNIYSPYRPLFTVHSPSCHTKEIPFGAIISIANRGRTMFLNDRLRPLGLSAGQFPVLMLLAREQNITQETLVRHYHLDKGTIARAVKKLEDNGYIRRITDPGNRRAVRLFLTEKGENALPVLHEINHAWESLAFSGLAAGDRETCRGLMRTVTMNVFAYMDTAGGLPDAGE
jgi:DNA-binding MarR family transcriptional regulator